MPKMSKYVGIIAISNVLHPKLCKYTFSFGL